MPVKTRFAPSPTGEPHIGNIRTALFSWLFARHNKGKFYLRIEDTDKSREVEGAVEKILESLEWMGIDWDEIPKTKSQIPNIVFQSQRLEIYKQYAESLVDKGYAYICACSEERLKNLREEQQKQDKPPMYDRHCREITNYELRITNYVIRLKVPIDGITEFDDLIRGRVKFENKLIDDQVLLKSDGYPTYHLANVIDDHLMEITHVIRGEDWLSSTPKHILLYNCFGWDTPKFAHLPMILGADKSKLSKRHGALSLLEYKSQGYLEDVLFNYLTLLGWNPGTNQEILTREEILKAFSLERVQKSPAVFDKNKLEWMNGVYIRKMPLKQLAKRIKQTDDPFFLKQVALVQERMKKLTDFIPLTLFIRELPDYTHELLIFKKTERGVIQNTLKASFELLSAIPKNEFNKTRLEHYFNQLISQHGFKVGEALHPLRVALTGLKDSPPAFEVAEVLRKSECLRRVKIALQKLE